MYPEIFAFSAILNGTIAFCFGLYVFFLNRKSRSNQLYFLLGLAVALWSFGYWKWQLSSTADVALMWARILSIGSTMVPVFYFHWIVLILGIEKKEKRKVIFIYIVAIIILCFSTTKWFVPEVREKLFFPFWPDPGILYHVYLLFVYFFIVIYSIFLLIKNYFQAKSELKAQIIYILIGSIVAYGGVTSNFFLWYDIPIPPYGNFLVALYPFFLGYALLKYHLFDIKVIATEFLTFVVWMILLAKVLFSRGLEDFILNTVLFIAIIFAGILLIRSILKEINQREKLEQLTKKIQMAYELEMKARKELERLGDAKTQFMIATQHHLRTPLTAIRGYIDLLLTGDYGKISPKVREVVTKVQISSNRLIRVVNEFLDVSQFQIGKEVVTLKPGVDLEPIFAEIMEELKFGADDRKIYLKLEKDKKLPKVIADSERLKVALYNFIDNAIKYTTKGGVLIRLAQENNKLSITIKDTGIGIAKEDIDSMFSRVFERGKDAKEVHGTGRGIGLYIASHIIRAHKGNVWVESEGRGKGSTFHVEIPIGDVKI